MLLANFSSPFYLLFGLLIGFMNYRNTERYRQATGKSPWGIPPIVWGIASVFLSLIATILALIAMNTGRGRNRGGMYGGGMYGGRMYGGGGMFGGGTSGGGGMYGGQRRPFRGQAPGTSSPYGTTSDSPEASPRAASRWSGHRKAGSEADGPSTLTVPTGGDSPAAPPSWQPDPSGAFDFRYWGGEEWTEFVSKDGVESRDPF